MSNETTTIKVTATPEWLAEQAVTRISSAGIVLKRADGRTVVHFGRQHVHAPEGEQLAAVRAWLVEQIRGAYKAGVESVAQTKADGAAAETYGPDALAKAREEGAALGRSEANVECGNELRAALGESHGWNACIALVRILAAKDGSECIGDRLAKAREEGRADAFRKVAEWCQTSVPDTIDFDASIVEEVAKDAIGHLQRAASEGDAKAREEGRRQGWAEAASCFDAKAMQHADTSEEKLWEANSLRVQASSLSEEGRVQRAAADMAYEVAKELRAAAPKEPA